MSAEAPRATPGRGGNPLWLRFTALAVLIVIADQLSKAWIVATVPPGGSMSIVGDYLRLLDSHNDGALFGLFRENATLFAVASLGVVALIVGLHARAGRSPYMTLTLGLLLGGAVGNLIDRLRLGYVVDFVDGGIGTVRWYTFNVADAAISVAIVLLVLLAVRPSLGGETAEGGHA